VRHERGDRRVAQQVGSDPGGQHGEQRPARRADAAEQGVEELHADTDQQQHADTNGRDLDGREARRLGGLIAECRRQPPHACRRHQPQRLGQRQPERELVEVSARRVDGEYPIRTVAARIEPVATRAVADVVGDVEVFVVDEAVGGGEIELLVPAVQQRRQGVPRIGQRRRARAEDEQADAAVTPELPHQWAAVDRVPGTASSRDRVVTPWILAL